MNRITGSKRIKKKRERERVINSLIKNLMNSGFKFEISREMNNKKKFVEMKDFIY